MALLIVTATVIGSGWLTMHSGAAAGITNIDACQTLDKFGETYRVTQDLSSCSPTDCLIVANDRITIDRQGHQIVSDCTTVGTGITDAGIGRDAITVKNGTVSFYFVGIDLGTSSRTTVRNVTASDNTAGIVVGSQSLVKDCHVHRTFIGISGHDRAPVHGCVASDNRAVGIAVGDGCLITWNEASNNRIGSALVLGDGIRGGERCTVSHNVANGNGEIGIGVGPKSLVTSNVANNSDVGMSAQCPSTVTNNPALGNDIVNFNPVGPGCVVQHNDFTDPQ